MITEPRDEMSLFKKDRPLSEASSISLNFPVQLAGAQCGVDATGAFHPCDALGQPKDRELLVRTEGEWLVLGRFVGGNLHVTRTPLSNVRQVVFPAIKVGK